MAWSDFADRVLKTCISTFKTEAVYKSYDFGTETTIQGVFDESAHDVNPGDIGVQSIQPTFGVRLADLSIAPNQGDTLLIKSKRYRLLDLVEDGQGGCDFILGKID